MYQLFLTCVLYPRVQMHEKRTCSFVSKKHDRTTVTLPTVLTSRPKPQDFIYIFIVSDPGFRSGQYGGGLR